MDMVEQYGNSQGWKLLPRSVIVEGTSDVSLFTLAAQHFYRETGKELFSGLAIVAAGEGEKGGTGGVVRQLITLRSLASTFLSPQGRPVYRIVGLFDNDTAGRKAVNGACASDVAIKEYRDVFRLRPVMPRTGSLDPTALQRNFEKQNEPYKGLDWELEDLIGDSLIELFLDEYPMALVREKTAENMVHRDLSRDGKSQLIKFCKENADLENMMDLVGVLHALRHYLNLPSLQ